jgi:arsenite methyltransferase
MTDRVDMTDAQLAKAERLRAEAGIGSVELREGRIEQPPVADSSIDLVISNGVINLSADKAAAFHAAARILVPGGRLALADIVTDRPLPEQIVCNAELWAACIGGAAQIDDYRAPIEAAGLDIQVCRTNLPCPAAPAPPPPPTASPASNCSPSNPPEPTHLRDSNGAPR